MKRPALGIKPRYIEFEDGVVISRDKIEKRYKKLCDTFKRRIDNNDSLEIEWLREYNQIIRYLFKE